jgi:hypothetical protein
LSQGRVETTRLRVILPERYARARDFSFEPN